MSSEQCHLLNQWETHRNSVFCATSATLDLLRNTPNPTRQASTCSPSSRHTSKTREKTPTKVRDPANSASWTIDYNVNQSTNGTWGGKNVTVLSFRMKIPTVPSAVYMMYYIPFCTISTRQKIGCPVYPYWSFFPPPFSSLQLWKRPYWSPCGASTTSWGPHSLRRLMAMPQETCRSPPEASWTGRSSPWPTATSCLNFTFLRWLQTQTVGVGTNMIFWKESIVNLLLFFCFRLCLCKGCCQEIQRIWDPGRDDWVVEVPEPRLWAGGVHQNLPGREGDPVCLSGCCEAYQISSGTRSS